MAASSSSQQSPQESPQESPQKLSQKPRYFGTDGIRAIAGEPPMTGLFAHQLGLALAVFLYRQRSSYDTINPITDTADTAHGASYAGESDSHHYDSHHHHSGPKSSSQSQLQLSSHSEQKSPQESLEKLSQKPLVVVGWDPRISSPMLAHSLTGGLLAAGANVHLLGMVPTPLVSFATRHSNAQLGVVISASHNPFAQNGIKLFAAQGEKFSVPTELAIEDVLAEIQKGQHATLSQFLQPVAAVSTKTEEARAPQDTKNTAAKDTNIKNLGDHSNPPPSSQTSPSPNPAPQTPHATKGAIGTLLPTLELATIDRVNTIDTKATGTKTTDTMAAYTAFLRQTCAPLDNLQHVTVVMDCANGACSQVAPQVLRALGATVIPLHHTPQGTNINTRCGSTHPEDVQAAVQSYAQKHAKKYIQDNISDTAKDTTKNNPVGNNLSSNDPVKTSNTAKTPVGTLVGVAFDGDGDRALLIDHHGRLLTGDHLLALCALAQRPAGVVSTVMANLGLEHFIVHQQMDFVRTRVGDRQVYAILQEHGLTLGGEQSGHLLFLNHAPTGDGILTVLQSLAALHMLELTPAEAYNLLTLYPQVLLNVPVPAAQKHALLHNDAIQVAISQAQTVLTGWGRINVRPSGTEALIRVMVEGAQQDAGRAKNHSNSASENTVNTHAANNVDDGYDIHKIAQTVAEVIRNTAWEKKA